MPIELNIKKIHFPDVPKGIGKDRVVRELMDLLPAIFDGINEDLLWIVGKGLTPEVFANPTEEIFKPLNEFFNKVQNLPNSKIKSALQKQIRIFVLVLKNRLEQVSEEVRADFETNLHVISSAIGIVPSLNNIVPLPSEIYLPKQFIKSKEQWVKMLYASPGRQSKENPLDFFTRSDEEGQISSVRRHLLFLDKNVKNPNEAMSYADADFYLVGDLQADHLQSSEQIIERQQEMLLAMNVDPIFTQTMKKYPESENYFIKGKDNLLYGTKYFYLVYHNCIDNLWLINTAANTGRGKGNEEALGWLREHPRFGKAFFDSLGGEAAIDQSKLFYLTPEGNLLAQAARQWFQATYQQEITAVSYFNEHVLKPNKAQLEKIPHTKNTHQKKRIQLNVMARLSLAKVIMQSSSTSSQDTQLQHSRSDPLPKKSSSIPSDDAEINEKNLQIIDQITLAEKSSTKQKVQNLRKTYKMVTRTNKLKK